jgi:hypothetical protein
LGHEKLVYSGDSACVYDMANDEINVQGITNKRIQERSMEVLSCLLNAKDIPFIHNYAQAQMQSSRDAGGECVDNGAEVP